MESGKNVVTYQSPKVEVLQTVKDAKKTLNCSHIRLNMETNGSLHINNDD